MTAGSIGPGRAQSPDPTAPVRFDLPAQPLSQALVAYSAATGLEIFYNAALATEQRSTGITGLLTPADALQILLRGTGYVARITAPGAVTIMPAPREALLSAAAAATARRRLEPYFATIQKRIGDALCGYAEWPSARRDLQVQFWLAPSGEIVRVEEIGDDGEPSADQSFAAAIRGLALVAPPAGMPQPVNMMIFPPSSGSTACGAAASRRGAG